MENALMQQPSHMYIDVEIGELYSSVEGESGVPVIGDKTWRSYR